MSVDFSEDLLLVTCASGKQASFLLPFLSMKWKKLRLAVNSQASRENLKHIYPDAEVVQADLAEPKDCQKLLEGVTAAYHIGPPLHPHETEIGYNMIDAAAAQKELTFKHFVFSSVLNTQLRKLLNHDCKRYVEEYLMESGLNYTILNPSNFMDNFPARRALDSSIATRPWSAETKFAHTSLFDLGEIGFKVLNEREKHYFAQYQIVSTAPASHRELCLEASKVLGKEVRSEVMSFETTMGERVGELFGLESDLAFKNDAARRLILYYNYHGLLGNPNVARWLLAREPTSFEDWLKTKLATLKGEEHHLRKARLEAG